MCWFKRFKINKLIKNAKIMQQYRQLNQPTDALIAKEIAIYFQLASLYEALKKHKKFPFAHEQMLACYRAAASMNDKNAQYLLGKNLLEEAKFREEAQNSVIFAHESNAKRMRELYNESHAYLSSASIMNHIQAKRLLGLCYINGWGVPEDKNKGFDLVIVSIEQENSWDRVQKVFAEIGINNSTFFSELFQYRNKK